MSSAPNAVAAQTPEVPPNISGGLTLLAKRLLPAKLNVADAAGKKNGFYFNAWAIAKGLRLTAMTAQAIADEFYRAVQADVAQQFPQLAWDVPPKALTRTQGEAPATRGDVKQTSAFEDRVQASRKADEVAAKQTAAQARCRTLVEQFAPTDHRRGTLKFDLRDTQQQGWRSRIASAKDFVKLEREIRDEQRKIYESLERAAEKL